MEGIVSIVKLISEYGIMLVICGLFLYILIRLSGILIDYLQNKYSTKKTKSDHEATMVLRDEVNTQVTTLLNEYFPKFDGDKIQVIEFSNSVTSVAYLPFKYMSCTYELTGLGISSTATTIQKLPTSLYTTFFAKLYENPYCLVDITDPEAVHYSGAFYSLMEENGAVCILCSMILDTNGKALGYVSIEDSENNFTDEDKERVHDLASKLSLVLSIAESKK